MTERILLLSTSIQYNIIHNAEIKLSHFYKILLKYKTDTRYEI
jgi:hypothetical protein